MILRTIFLIIALLTSSTAFAERKVALLIGNSAYSSPATALKNPPNDIAAMKATLESGGFEVTVLENAGRAAMSETLATFEQAVSGAEIGLIYYSGHGIEVNGDNFLIPVDAKLASDRDVKYETILLDDLLHALAGATKLKLVLLDACRDNPFLTSMKRLSTRGIPTRGLARADTAESNMLIGYATAPGDVALDGDGAMSPYATALTRHLVTPGYEIEVALRRVARDVYEATNRKQRPFLSGSLFETVMLGGPGGEAAQSKTAHQPRCDGAEADWAFASAGKDPDLLTKHLEAYSQCDFAARARWELLRYDLPVKLPSKNAVLYEEDSAKRDVSVFSGTITWQIMQDAKSDSNQGEPIIVGEINIPEKEISSTITIKRNKEFTYGTNYTFDIKFRSKDNPSKGVISINRVMLQEQMASDGTFFNSKVVQSRQDNFTLGFSDSAMMQKSGEISFKNAGWIEISFVYKNLNRAGFVFENVSSDNLFNIAVGMWRDIARRSN